MGVHTALGAFVAGMLVGQSPILTEHIESELRGFIFAFFSPVFFAVAGLGMDLTTLLDPTLLLFTLAVIGVASLGKFLGALAGGRLGGLTGSEVAGAGDRSQRARFDRGDHRQHRPVDGSTQQSALHHDRRHGGGHDHDHAADAALGSGAGAAAGGGGQASREGGGRRARQRAQDGARAGLCRRRRQRAAGVIAGRHVRRAPAGTHHRHGAVEQRRR